MLHGLALAQALLSRCVRPGTGERALALQTPQWSSRSPTAPVAIAVQHGDLLHLVAVVDTWDLVTSPPASLRARFARRWKLSNDGPDVEALGDALRSLSEAWFESARDEVGVLDVTGALTYALAAGLGTQRGAFGNHFYGDPDPNGPGASLRASVGREVPSVRWPTFVDVRTDEHAVLSSVSRLDQPPQQVLVRTATELAAALPPMVEALRGLDDACASGNIPAEHHAPRFAPPPTFTEEEVASLMRRLRAGEKVCHSTSGGRYSMTWSYDNGAWLVDDWQEGTSMIATLSAAEMRESIAHAPEEAFRRLLKR